MEMWNNICNSAKKSWQDFEADDLERACQGIFSIFDLLIGCALKNVDDVDELKP
jgi:hypothetical protein